MRLLGLTLLLQTIDATPKCLIIEEAADGWKSLTSPDYPKKFSPFTQCIYRLSAPEGERIEIEFVDFLLFNNDAEECAQQGLSIRDPEIETPIGKYCGNTKPPNYSTMGNQLFFFLESSTDGEYKGFHIKFRIYGSSPHLNSEVIAMEPAKKTKKSTPKKSVKKSAPVKSGSMGAQILAAMNAKKNNKIMLKSSGEKQGDFDTKSLEATIEMQAPKHRRRRQGYGGGRGYSAYDYAPAPPARGRGAARAPARNDPYEAPAPARSERKPGCKPGYPCTDGTTDTSSSYSPPREIKCIGNGCNKTSSSGKRYLTYLVWFIVIAVFGGIGWYIYQTYFAEDEEKKKKQEEDEKKKEAEGNIGAATLARGLGSGQKIPGFDAPPRYESWQDHAQPAGK